MKALFITPAIILTVALSLNAQAADETHDEAAHGEQHDAGHAAEGKSHRDNNALFPQPKADVAGKGTAPKAVQMIAPKFHATVPAGTVTLSWNASEGADAYHVQVATDPAFKWLKADEHFVNGTSFEAKDLEKGKTYYWRVAPWKNGNMAAANKGTFTPSVFVTE